MCECGSIIGIRQISVYRSPVKASCGVVGFIGGGPVRRRMSRVRESVADPGPANNSRLDFFPEVCYDPNLPRLLFFSPREGWCMMYQTTDARQEFDRWSTTYDRTLLQR